MERLQLGVAYHSNRIVRHVRDDMLALAEEGFDSVLHMFTHNDMERHRSVMADIIALTQEQGLEVWVDNWGLTGSPGDSSHFLSYQPDARQIYNTGEPWRKMVCLNSPEFLAFTKEWIDMVYDCGGRKIFWDEPCLTARDKVNGVYRQWTCACPSCRKLFAERFGHAMPDELTPEVEAFRRDTVLGYFSGAAGYAKEKGMVNTVCVMLGDSFGVDVDSIAGHPALDNVGTDPYWTGHGILGEDVYRFVYEATRHNLELCRRYGKEHNVWLQAFNIPAGREEEMFLAADAIYEAGARSIWTWGFRAGESNDYRCGRPDIAWKTVLDAMAHLRRRHREDTLVRCRGKLGDR